jgi:hypothetical protein
VGIRNFNGYGVKRDEVTGEKRRFNKEELNDLYSSPNFIRAIESRRRWPGHVAGTGARRGAHRVWGDVRERDHLENTGVSGRIILKWKSKKWDGEYRLD